MLAVGNRSAVDADTEGGQPARLPLCPVLPADKFSGMASQVDQAASFMTQNRRTDIDALVLRVAEGDRQALKTLYERTAAKLYGICRRVLPDEADAQDALQEVFVLVWRKAARFDPAKASAITWLATLARNKAIDRVRVRREPSALLDEADHVASDAPSQLEVVEQAEDAERLARCLDELDERARIMIKTAFLDGYSYPELASREGVPLATMKSWIRRGLIRLRGCLER